MEELFVRHVDIGVAEMDIADGNDLTTTRVVVERATAANPKGGPDRELLLVYGAAQTKALAEALHRASDQATA
jgi:hypothetical protein